VAHSHGSNGVSGSSIEHTDAPPSGRLGTFASLRFRNYRFLWFGQFSHASALWMEQIARPLLVLDITDSGEGLALGVAFAMRTLPQLFFGLIAGAFSDRFDRRMVLLVDKSGVLTMNVLFAALVVAGSIELWHIYAFEFVRGSLMAFDQPARQSMIPAVVEPRYVTNAVALMSATQNTMRILGVAIGGALVAALGFSGVFITIAIVYVGAVVATYLIRLPKRPSTGRRGVQAGQVFREIGEGARFAVAHPTIRGILVLSLAYYTFGMTYMQLFLPLFAEKAIDFGELGVGTEWGLSLMLALTGAGALIAALFIANRQPDRLGLILPIAVIVFGGLLTTFAVATLLPGKAGVLVPLPMIFLVGALQTTYFSLSNAALLHAAPDEMRGRVVSLISLDRAMIALGAAVGGILADALGVVSAQITFALIAVAGAALVLWLSPQLRRASARADASRPSTPPLPRPASHVAASPRPDAPTDGAAEASHLVRRT